MKKHKFHTVIGMSLLELMISMTLGAFVIATLIELSLIAKRTYAANQALAHLQEDARFITLRINEDIYHAGYIGCLRLSEVIPEKATALHFSADTRLVVFHNGTSTASYPFPLLGKPAKPDSDVLIVQQQNPQAVAVILARHQEIQLTQAADFKAGDTILISDCNHAEIAHISRVWGANLFLSADLAHEYEIGAQVGELSSWVYYIAATGRKNESNKPIYALYRRDLSGSATQPSEWVDNVDAMRIQLGVRQKSNSPISFYDANNVPDWRHVVLVQLEFLLSSEENVLTKPQTYVFNNKNYMPDDRRLYRSWRWQVALRESV